jgi:hypothetical protein
MAGVDRSDDDRSDRPLRQKENPLLHWKTRLAYLAVTALVVISAIAGSAACNVDGLYW